MKPPVSSSPAMRGWLVKEEPTHYSFDDLQRDGATTWSGIHNALALRHLRNMRRGDRVLYYHTGTERAVVGIARVGGTPQPDRSDPRGSWSVEIRPVRRLRAAVPLSTLRSDPRLRGSDLVRLGRLSVLPIGTDEWSAILSYEPDPERPRPRAR